MSNESEIFFNVLTVVFNLPDSIAPICDKGTPESIDKSNWVIFFDNLTALMFSPNSIKYSSFFTNTQT